MATVNLTPPFEAYKGDKPYLFVSYAHADAVVVYPDIELLHSAGFRIWYDQGIELTQDWLEVLERALSKAHYFVVFHSPEAYKSQHVYKEIRQAMREDKVILPIFIAPAELPDSQALDVLKHPPYRLMHHYQQ